MKTLYPFGNISSMMVWLSLFSGKEQGEASTVTSLLLTVTLSAINIQLQANVLSNSRVYVGITTALNLSILQPVNYSQ